MSRIRNVTAQEPLIMFTCGPIPSIAWSSGFNKLTGDNEYVIKSRRKITLPMYSIQLYMKLYTSVPY